MVDLGEFKASLVHRVSFRLVRIFSIQETLGFFFFFEGDLLDALMSRMKVTHPASRVRAWEAFDAAEAHMWHLGMRMLCVLCLLCPWDRLGFACLSVHLLYKEFSPMEINENLDKNYAS